MIKSGASPVQPEETGWNGRASQQSSREGRKGQERWIVLRGPAEAINLEKITFDRSTLNSIQPEERERERERKENTRKKENGCRAGMGQEGNR